MVGFGDSSDSPPGTKGCDRGQLVLIAAVTIAFILLGVVVVFNGVLYTQTLSASQSGQTTAEADRIELEVTDAVCMIDDALEEAEEDDFNNLEGTKLATGSSASAEITNVEVNDDVEVTIRYIGTDLEYNRTITVDTGDDCPVGGSSD